MSEEWIDRKKSKGRIVLEWIGLFTLELVIGIGASL